MEPQGQIDWTAIATFALAGVTLVLAIATVWLGLQAKAEIGLTRQSEIARRSEVHIVDADPLTAAFADLVLDGLNQPAFLKIQVGNPGDKPSVGITATLRSDQSDVSFSPAKDLLTPGDAYTFTYPIGALFHYKDPNAGIVGGVEGVTELQIVVESHGLLGQRVLQTFRYMPERMFNPNERAFYLERLEIAPNVEGGTSAVTTVALYSR